MDVNNLPPAQQSYLLVVARRLKQFREDAGLSTTKLAAAIDKSGQTVYLYETGTRPLPMEILPDLAAALGVRIADIVREPDDTSEAPKKRSRRRQEEAATA